MTIYRAMQIGSPGLVALAVAEHDARQRAKLRAPKERAKRRGWVRLMRTLGVIR